MNFQTIEPGPSLALFVKSIMVFEEARNDQKTALPFFADGCPGLIFYQSQTPLKAYPHNKLMPPLFLYGQTLHPIELVFEGSYKMIVFQFFPFILKSFFGLTPKDLNNSCYDLQGAGVPGTPEALNQLQNNDTLDAQIETLSAYLYSIFLTKQQLLDAKLKQALLLIMENRGQLTIEEIGRRIHVNKRTLERRFVNETGLQPKQFAKIIQFHSSLQQLSLNDFTKLTDIVYENGFADQSHFIKVFKAFTGKTPKLFLKE